MSTVAVAPWPLVSFKANPFRAIWNKVVALLYIVLVGAIAFKIIAGFYDLTLETIPWVTARWHRLISNPATRHAVRDVGEGYYASLLAQAWVWNHWRPLSIFSRYPPFRQISAAMAWFERLIHAPIAHDDRDSTKGSLIWGVVLTFFYAIPGFFFGRWVIQQFDITGHLNHWSGTLQRHISSRPSSWLAQETTTITTSLPNKLVGIFSGIFFGRRPARGVYDDGQALLARRHRAIGRRYSPVAKLVLPAGYLARCNEIADLVSVETARRQRSQTVKVLWGLFILFNVVCLCVGEYFLHHYAK